MNRSMKPDYYVLDLLKFIVLVSPESYVARVRNRGSAQVGWIVLSCESTCTLHAFARDAVAIRSRCADRYA